MDLEASREKRFNRRSAHRLRVNEINNQKKRLAMSKKCSETNVVSKYNLDNKRPQSALDTKKLSKMRLLRNQSEMKYQKSDSKKGGKSHSNYHVNEFRLEPTDVDVDQTSRLKEQQYAKYQRILKQHRELLNEKYQNEKNVVKGADHQEDNRNEEGQEDSVIPLIGVKPTNTAKTLLSNKSDTRLNRQLRQIRPLQDKLSLIKNPADLALRKHEAMSKQFAFPQAL